MKHLPLVLLAWWLYYYAPPADWTQLSPARRAPVIVAKYPKPESGRLCYSENGEVMSCKEKCGRDSYAMRIPGLVVCVETTHPIPVVGGSNDRAYWIEVLQELTEVLKKK